MITRNRVDFAGGVGEDEDGTGMMWGVGGEGSMGVDSCSWGALGVMETWHSGNSLGAA